MLIDNFECKFCGGDVFKIDTSGESIECMCGRTWDIMHSEDGSWIEAWEDRDYFADDLKKIQAYVRQPKQSAS